MATNKWEYFSSRKNQVGMIAAALMTGLFIVLGLVGAAGVIPWLVATTAAYGAGALLTPSREQKALEPSVPTQALIDAEVQENLTKLHRANVPPPVYNEALALQGAVRFVLSRWDDLNATPEHQQTVYNVSKIYFPEVVTTYLNSPLYRGEDASLWCMESLDTMTKAVDRVKQGILDNNLRALESQATYLKEALKGPISLDDAALDPPTDPDTPSTNPYQ
ncbi:hypothetical protein [Corynebacterium sp. p3-SID1056]|uniref:hypothetical protein n=1 Tax=Corynebacterium sp. p3-SID1056 TaxID=2916092 RepID=UPI0021A7EBF9|nr:hypothetical protein [Corynebacterium sp. p3-SID1056]MCT2338745.1 hypothetical protein [Corynebacterium sp. p3-SID1056]